jgi:hypothetical protein
MVPFYYYQRRPFFNNPCIFCTAIRYIDRYVIHFNTNTSIIQGHFLHNHLFPEMKFEIPHLPAEVELCLTQMEFNHSHIP